MHDVDVVQGFALVTGHRRVLESLGWAGHIGQHKLASMMMGG